MLPRSSASRISLSLALLAGVSCVAREARAQESLPLVTVVVTTADTRQPLPGAEVEVLGVGRGAATNENGIARLEKVRAGRRRVLVRHAGYLSTETALEVTPNGTELLQVEMIPLAVQLEGVRVQGELVRETLARNGFYQRKLSGQGVYFTREEVEAAAPSALTDLLRRVPGLSFTPKAYDRTFGQTSATLRGPIGRECEPQVFVDGAQTVRYDIDTVRPEHVEGIEVYRGAASLPSEYNRGAAACGVVLIWTKVD